MTEPMRFPLRRRLEAPTFGAALREAIGGLKFKGVLRDGATTQRQAETGIDRARYEAGHCLPIVAAVQIDALS